MVRLELHHYQQLLGGDNHAGNDALQLPAILSALRIDDITRPTLPCFNWERCDDLSRPSLAQPVGSELCLQKKCRAPR